MLDLKLKLYNHVQRQEILDPPSNTASPIAGINLDLHKKTCRNHQRRKDRRQHNGALQVQRRRSRRSESRRT